MGRSRVSRRRSNEGGMDRGRECRYFIRLSNLEALIT
jgi:hypothetical protein